MAGYEVSEVDVWAADIPDRPGTLSRLLETMSEAGAELEFMIARPVDGRGSRVFVAPVKGAKAKKAAQSAGLAPATSLHSIRIEGPNKLGLGTRITRAIAEQGINLRGVSAAGLGTRAVFYIAIEDGQAVKQARKAVKDALKAKAAAGKRTA